MSGKYDKLFRSNATNTPIPKTPKHLPHVLAMQEYWPDFPNIGGNFGINCISEAQLIPDPPHKHDFDEFLFFIGGNPLDMGEFDAEVEFIIGEDWEVHTITSPTIIILPKETQHAPINFKRIDKPILYGHFMMAGKYSTEDNDGIYLYDEDTRPEDKKADVPVNKEKNKR